MQYAALDALRAVYPAAIALFGVLVFGWSALPIALTYWLDTVIDMVVTGIGISRSFPAAPLEEREAFISAQASSKVNGTPVSKTMREGIRQRGLAASGSFVARTWITFRLAFAGGIAIFLFLFFIIGREWDVVGTMAGLLLAAMAMGIGGWFALRNMSRDHLPDVASADRRFWTMYIALFLGLVLTRPLGLLFLTDPMAPDSEVPFIVIVLVVQVVLGSAWQYYTSRRQAGTRVGE